MHAGFLGNFCLGTNPCVLASAASFVIDDFVKSNHCTLVLAVSVHVKRIVNKFTRLI